MRVSQVSSILLILTMCFTAGCNDTEGVRQGGASVTNAVDKIVAEIATCPAWRDATPDVWNDIIRCNLGLCKHDSNLIRKAMGEYISTLDSQKKYDSSAMSRLFILNRVLFQVPDKDANWRPSGGWGGQTADTPLWPLAQDKDGALRISSMFQGYLGSAFSALEEFDDFSKRYGRRNVTEH